MEVVVLLCMTLDGSRVGPCVVQVISLAHRCVTDRDIVDVDHRDVWWLTRKASVTGAQGCVRHGCYRCSSLCRVTLGS